MREQLEAEENRLVPEYVQDYFLRGFAKLGGRFSEIEKGFRIEFVPMELRSLNQDLSFKTRYGTLHREYRRVTFEKDVARHDTSYEFVAPGHPLLEALNEVILGTFKKESTQYAAFTDPTNVRQGALWFVEGVVRDGSGTEAGRRVFCVLETPEGEMRTLNPAVLWDLEPVAEADVPKGILERMTDRSTIKDHLVEAVLFPYRDEIEERRQRDVQVKERYGLKSLDYLIQESNEKLLDYEMRTASGEDMEIATRNERRNLERLEHRRGELVREIRLEANVTVDEPRILGVAALVAQPKKVEYPTTPDEPAGVHEDGEDYGVDPERKKEIEMVGMRVATKYEEEHGWRVEDVSGEDHGGFDLRSIRIGDDGTIEDVRYIEVKARARTGAIRITSNEWKKARRYGPNYWLYVVTEAASDEPVLQRIPNPAAHFKEGEGIFATGFIIPEGNWRQHTDTPGTASSVDMAT